MKRIVSLILSAAMLLGTASAAFAADNALGEKLSDVTAKVKTQLGIGNEYTSFYGTAQDNGLNEYWNLLWQKEDGTRLSVDATPEGKIMSYNLSSSTDDYRYGSDFAPAFPEFTREDAKAAAQRFLNKVLDTATESVELRDSDTRVQPQTANYYFSGTLKLNGLDSPIYYSVRVNAATKSVSSFSRDDFYTKYLGGVPGSVPSASEEDASKLLKDTIKLKLEYTTYAPNGETDKAVLRYVPVYTGYYIVDAASGKLINTDDLYDSIQRESFDQSAAQDSASGGSMKELSPAEQEGIDKLAGVLSKDELDSAVRGMGELGLESFTLANTYYSKADDDKYFCNLTYAKADGENKITRKYAYVDAKTAELISLFTSYPYREDAEKGPLTQAEAQKTAESFLAKYYNDNFSKTKQYPETASKYDEENTTSQSFTYAEQANGYFFPENAYYLSVNTENGSIDSFGGSFRDVVFDSADGIISMEQARNTYFDAFETKLTYVNLPKKLDIASPEFEPYIRKGYSYLYELKLAYTSAAENPPYAVDAKSGKNLYYENKTTELPAYSDVKAGKEILGLAAYGIGYAGGVFQKTKKLTQIDMVALLVSANGYIYDPSNGPGAADQLYQEAYYLGILKNNQRSDDKEISRAELAKTILSMSGYGKAAELPGIFVCTFKDEASIPAEYYGYVAIAQGLGMVKGGPGETFAPNAVATREDAAVMLYNFMSR